MSTIEAILDLVLARITNIDPENASQIMGQILLRLQISQLPHLASSSDTIFHTAILFLRNHMGLPPLSSSSSSSSSATPPNSSSSSHAMEPFSLFSVDPISLKSSSSVSHNNIHAGSSSKSPLSSCVKGETSTAAGDSVDVKLMGEYLSLRHGSMNDEELVDPRLEMGHSRQHSVAHHISAQSHNMRSYSEANETDMVGVGYQQPCPEFAKKGFCRYGSNCKFVHTRTTLNGAAANNHAASSGGAFVGSPSRNFGGLEEQQQEEMNRLRAMQNHQRLMAAAQEQQQQFLIAAGALPVTYDQYVHYMMQLQHDPQRFIYKNYKL